MRQFGYTEDESGAATILPCALKSLVSDCCTVYIPGVSTLNELLKREIVRAGCYAHLRRYFIDALTSMDLRDVFNAVAQGDLCGFNERLDAELNARDRQLSQTGRKVIYACFLIQIIFQLEVNFANADRGTIEEQRQTKTKEVVNSLFKTINELRESVPSIKKINKRDGGTEYKGGGDVPWGQAVVYGLNHTEELHAFLSNGDIECSNNRAERILRPAKMHGRSMEFLATANGFFALADLMTIGETCRLNGINVYDYLHWALTNIKLRLEVYRLTVSKVSETTAQMCLMPGPIKKGEKVIDPYDHEYKCCYDNISVNGLDPTTYKQLLKQEQARIKPEFLAT